MAEIEQRAFQKTNSDATLSVRQACQTRAPRIPRLGSTVAPVMQYGEVATADLVQPGSPAIDHPQVAAFTDIILRADEARVREFTDELLASGVSVQSIYLDLLAPSARALGDLWEDDRCDFIDVTLGVSRLQLVLRDLGQMLVLDHPDQPGTARALLACLPGEQHSLGLFMVAEFFVRDGWAVRVGPPLSEADLLAELRSEWYDMVGFSVSCNSRLDQLKREIRRVRQASRNPAVVVMAGGRAFDDHPELLARVGADASAPNAELAPERARQLMAIRP